jgi:CheY-like chemotaxis protein
MFLAGRKNVTDPVEPVVVLLVEDGPEDEWMTREAFAEHKNTNNMYVVRDGEQALQFLYRRGVYAHVPRPDLILLDLNLPRIDGRQVLARIKSDPELSVVPVVILTSSAAEEDLLRSYRLQANAYITKPVLSRLAVLPSAHAPGHRVLEPPGAELSSFRALPTRTSPNMAWGAAQPLAGAGVTASASALTGNFQKR